MNYTHTLFSNSVALLSGTYVASQMSRETSGAIVYMYMSTMLDVKQLIH